MNWESAWDTVLKAVAAVGGLGVIIVGLSAWMGNIWSNRLAEKDRLASEQKIIALQAEYAKQLQQANSEIEQQKHEMQHLLDIQRLERQSELDYATQVHAQQRRKFLETQFDLYLALWDRLQELRFAADILWKEATLENLGSFAGALHQTRLYLEKASVVMDQRTYERLHRLLESFEHFRVGKRQLIDLRTNASVQHAFDEAAGSSPIAKARIIEEIKAQVERNRFDRREFYSLLNDIKGELHRKLEGSADLQNAAYRSMDY